MTKPHSDQGRPLADRRSAGLTVDSLTNSVMQDVARSLIRQGCRGGLGDSRPLREAVKQVVSRNLRAITDRQPELEPGESR